MTARTELPPTGEPPFDPYYDAPTPTTNGQAETPLTGWSPHQPPQDAAAERALLGAILHEPRHAPYAATLIDSDDFYHPKHMNLWDAIHAVAATGTIPEPTLVLEHLRRTGTLRPGLLDGPYIHECLTAGQYGQIDDYARVVLDTAKLRTALHCATQITQAVKSARRETVTEAMGHVVDVLDRTAGRFGATNTTPRHNIETIDELLAGEDEDTYSWVIPDLIEHQERIILTAEEGAGKSTLLRQIAIQAASGIHPFAGTTMPPINVLHIDVENTRRQSRRRYRPMRIQAGDALDPQRLRLELRTGGIDLTQTTDRDWLLSTCQHVQPDLLLIGPIYKLANGDPTEEKSAKPVAMAIDAVREATDTAVILEAHAAKAPTGQKRRPHEPYGWSGWLRWPEVGLWLDKNGDITPWRGAREERPWPTKLERGGTWPWSPAITELAEHWNDIRLARQTHGQPMSFRQISQATGKSKGHIQRLIGTEAPYAYAWRLINQAATHTFDDDQENPDE